MYLININSIWYSGAAISSLILLQYQSSLVNIMNFLKVKLESVENNPICWNLRTKKDNRGLSGRRTVSINFLYSCICYLARLHLTALQVAETWTTSVSVSRRKL